MKIRLSISRIQYTPYFSMWRIARIFRARPAATLKVAPHFSRPAISVLTASAFVASATLFGNTLSNDASENSLEGITVDSSISPFPTEITPQNSCVSADHKLIASGVRSVTFVGFKVYGVGLYIPTKHELKIAATVREYAKRYNKTAETLLNDKEISQQLVLEISQNVPYALRITPVRNTDFGHLRDGFVKSILASPMAKTRREEVAEGIQQLRAAFQGFKGSVPKDHSLWLVFEPNGELTITYEGKGANKELGRVDERSIGQCLLVLYLSSAKPLSEPLRQDFVHYAGGL